MKRILILKDMRENKLFSVTILVFILLASLLLSTGAGVAASLSSSMSKMFKEAKTPHFMQMHVGEVDQKRMMNFVESQDNIEDYQLAEFLNIDGTKISLGKDNLSWSVQDNGLTTQNEKFDFLLDLEGKMIQVKPGEIYVPLYYMQELKLKEGDEAKIADKTFRIAGFLRDSQMNAALVSSKRFVVHEEDYQQLLEEGSLEYLIGFRLYDPSKSSTLESEYVGAGLESNGPPAITHTLFKLINLITDGIFIALLALISFFVLGIALLCVRFILLAKIGEEYREIGVLKALGMNSKALGELYLSKYLVLAGVSSALGFFLSFVLKKPFIEKIELYMGKGEGEVLGIALGALGSLLVFLMVYLYIRRVLSKFKQISAAQALRFGGPVEKKKLQKSLRLQKSRLKVTSLLGIRDLLSEKKVYFTMLVVLILSVFLILVPLNMYNTIEDPSFMGYMGLGDYDLRIDVSQVEGIEEKAREILTFAEEDQRIKESNLLISRMIDVELDPKRIEKIKVEIGNHQRFQVNYLEGGPPLKEDEIALSLMNADDLELKVGSQLSLRVDGEKKNLRVVGIYSDITNGGKTAKATLDVKDAKVLWAVIPLRAHTPQEAALLLQEYRSKYPFAKVSDAKEYIHQTFGNTIRAVGSVVKISSFVTLVLVFTLTLLFMRMIYAKSRREIALLKSMGFRDGDLRRQYLLKAGIIMMISLLFAVLLANTLGEYLGSQLLGQFGAVGVKFISKAPINYGLVPLALFLTVMLSTFLSVKDMPRLKISRFIKE